MTIQIGSKPDSDFTDPLGLMSDCHRRVERFLDQLIRLTAQVYGRALTEVEREALDTSLRYFRLGAPMHTADEERSLFPRLRALNDRALNAVLEGVAGLEAEHRTAGAAHAEIDELGHQWLRQDRLSAAESATLLRLVRALRAVYRTHIAFEDNELFPLASSRLDAASIEEMGREMALRRGLDYDNLPAVNRCVERRLTRETIEAA